MVGDRSLTKLGAAFADLDEAARERLDDAEVLLQGARYAGAIIHAIYALEIKLKDVIEREAKPKLRVINSHGPVLRGMKDFASYTGPRLGPAEMEIDEKLINNGVSWSEPFRPYSRSHSAPI